MQKTLHLVIHNAVKDNFTRAGVSRNAQSAKDDTLCCSNAENPLPQSHRLLSKTASLGRGRIEMQKMWKTTPSPAQMQKTLPLVIQNAIEESFTWAGMRRNTENSKTTALVAQMQKTPPLPIRNAIRDNFTWAGMSRNAESAENDTLCCTNAENLPPSQTKHYQRQLHLG